MEPRFLARGVERRLEPGEALCRPAEAPLAAYVVSGEVVCSSVEPRPGLPARRAGPGALVGLVDCCAPGGLLLYRCEAAQASVVYCWERDGLLQAMGLFQELAREVIQSLSAELRAVNRLPRGEVARRG